jgi:hypothetical protein
MKAFLVALIALAACGPAPAVRHPGQSGPQGFVITPGGGSSGGALSGGTNTKYVKWTGASSVSSGLTSDDGTTVTASKTLSAATASNPTLYGVQTGTIDTTGGVTVSAIGVKGEATATESAGTGVTQNIGVLGLASGAPDNNWAGRFQASGTAGTDNRGVQIDQSSALSGGTAYGLHILVNGASTTNLGIKVGTVNGLTTNRALETSDGDVKLNTQSGTTFINGDLTLSPVNPHMDASAATHLFSVGAGGTSNVFMIEKHNTAPSSSANCTSGTGSITAVDNKWASFKLGSTATFPCVITFASPAPFSNTPSCLVVPIVGSNEAALSYSETGTALTLSAGTAGAEYRYFCGGH